jgi:ABC-type tungstate transport system permease subunit
MLVGKDARNEEIADRFVQWVISEEGQNTITGFKKNGEQLYTEAPENKTAPYYTHKSEI